ncbi:MAG: molybdopterin-dependent oxidoreductase [Candidatus Heimdallarchaeota archaeon]|nr:molybdopterin-dependent oxidoreductase [Candidatus Heimdallarchaeota archaeon]
MKIFGKKKSAENRLDYEEYGPLSKKEDRERVPPGQYLAKRWPVLSAERPPKFDGENWDITVDGLVENPVTWTWKEFTSLPKTTQTSDIHCVTTWSLLDQKFSGVSFKTILDIVRHKPEAKYVTFEAKSGYTTAIPLAEGYLYEDDVLLAYEHDGNPLEKDHGGPLRSLVPQLYLWKSVKWLTKISFKEVWERGFWEERGYHQKGDPWLNERYSRDEPVKRRDAKIQYKD